ncbi:MULTISPECIES: amino acid ABC transporter permease [unclassified Chelatococcus]|uniref:amino acid ABC transporter permease n=1 Tax=unclassified Chelatococcus TaxID=2638111 RepID=UPI001BD02D38|nr:MULTISPECIES: amino acid ABC transporter permease [unclassified Chelatococcus]MBS7741822.1 amino acid ABC transporter permease [Chelatococcus sp. HY11]MBX3541380.1 amino acid ABC transporter permease [Chelatococcus sp.]MCO5074726.1 amino acid ABC transporter permease [Chelatococcus sp.]
MFMRSFGFNDVWYLLIATQWTIYLTVVAFLVGGALGLWLALARTGGSRVGISLALVWIRAFQNTPLLVQLFLIYYGLGLFGFRLPPFVAAAVGLICYASAFLAEIWRGCILAVPRQQWEAADALALTPWQIRWYVILPQALRIAIPPTVGFLVKLIKNSSLASVVGMTELMRAATAINNATFQPFKVFLCAAIIYFLLCFPLTMLSRRFERQLDVSTRG